MPLRAFHSDKDIKKSLYPIRVARSQGDEAGKWALRPIRRNSSRGMGLFDDPKEEGGGLTLTGARPPLIFFAEAALDQCGQRFERGLRFRPFRFDQDGVALARG